MLPYQQIAFPPGSRFSYSNPSWIYLARILEQKTGDPWDAYIQKNIFAPLGMTRSYFRLTPYYLRDCRSHNYSVEPGANGEPEVIDHGAEFDPGVTVPNGGWNGPLADAATFIGFLTGSTGGRAELAQRFETVLKHSTLEEMWQPRQRLAPDSDGYMGLAFFMTGAGDHRVIGHTGGQANFSTLLYFNPHTRRGVVAAFNTENKLDEKHRPRYFRDTEQKVLELLR
jgi:CubicO group peptidase (beta-lactamase class C family)